jgi:cellulose synthase/poly-beta-1,6-N-acetylglucosamine synthase-like glycosyltransferase
LKNKPYRLDFAVDAVCWTEVPESFEVLKKQRVRWQRGLFDAITMNKEMLFNPKSRGVGMAAMPFLAFWEGLSPLVETFGYIVFVIFFWAGLMSWQGCLAFLLMSLGTGVLMTTCSLLVEELSFKTYLRSRDVAWLFYLGIIENLGFRQVMAFWRLEGTYKWIRGSEFKWGEMTRVASWQAEPSAKPATPNLGQPAEKQQTPVASEAAASPSADA